ncbi:MAG: tol-pal system protein YbgF [Henriciella sp.]|nr:tol-pal system protein YbgF [Henriciella sp.]
MMRQTLVLALLTATIVFTVPAEAQRRGAKITQGVTSSDFAATTDTLRAANAELGARLTGLEADRAELSGQVETLEFLLSQSRDQINDMQADDAEIGRLIGQLETRLSAQDSLIGSLEARLNSLEESSREMAFSRGEIEPGSEPASDLSNTVTTTSAPNVTPGGPRSIVRRTVTTSSAQPEPAPQGSLGTISASALPGEAGPLFAAAKSRLLQFDYAGAEAAFRSFLSQFGDDPQAGEAQYWLGEVLYQQEAYAESGQAYTQMIRQYPDDPRAPEALAKLARSMRLVGDTDKACNALDILPQRYPDASGVTKNLAAGERVRSSCDS